MIPRVSEVIPMIKNGLGKEQEVRDDEGGASRAGCEVEQVQSTGQPAKVAMPSEGGENCCKKDMEAHFF